MTPAQTKFFPPKIFASTELYPNRGATRRVRSLDAQLPFPQHGLGYRTPHLGVYNLDPHLSISRIWDQISHHLPREPLRIVELHGGLATGLKALLRVGYAIHSYVWVDIDPDAHMVVASPHYTPETPISKPSPTGGNYGLGFPTPYGRPHHLP